MSSDHPKVKNFSSPRLYKGNSKSILVGCSCKHPSLNSHENGVLRGCFFKNSKYVYNIPSHLIAIGSAQIKRGKQTFLSSNSRRERPIYQMQNEIPLLITCHLPRQFERMSKKIYEDFSTQQPWARANSQALFKKIPPAIKRKSRYRGVLITI